MKHVLVLLMLMALAAADLFAIQITPTYQVFTVKPGGKSEGRCTVSNNDEENLTLTLSSKDWFVLPGNEEFKAPDWLTFKEKEFPLKKGDSKDVSFFINAPKKAKGELVGMMSITTTGEIASNVNKMLSVAIYAAMEGTEIIKGDIKAIMITPSSSTMVVSVLFVNKGNVHLRPLGFFQVENEKGQPVANIFLEQGRPAYPEKEAVYSGEVKDFHIDPGIYKSIITMTDIDRKVEILKKTRKFEILENYSVELK